MVGDWYLSFQVCDVFVLGGLRFVGFWVVFWVAFCGFGCVWCDCVADVCGGCALVSWLIVICGLLRIWFAGWVDVCGVVICRLGVGCGWFW